MKELELSLREKEKEQAEHVASQERRIAEECRSATEEAIAEKNQALEVNKTLNEHMEELRSLVSRTAETLERQSTMQKKVRRLHTTVRSSYPCSCSSQVVVVLILTLAVGRRDCPAT